MGFRRLQHLDVSDCKELSGEEILRLATNHPTLSILKANNCRGLGRRASREQGGGRRRFPKEEDSAYMVQEFCRP